jgi:hypothetical protein
MATQVVDPVVAEIEQARCRYLAACDQATAAATRLTSGGYGCPDALRQDEYQVTVARADSERLYREYQDLERRYTQQQILQLQRSQKSATWASFCVAAAVGLATIAGVIVQMAK